MAWLVPAALLQALWSVCAQAQSLPPAAAETAGRALPPAAALEQPTLAPVPPRASAPSNEPSKAADSAAESFVSSPGEPSAQVQADYRDVVARAVVEFDAGRFAEARAFFLRAHEMWPSARTYRVLGMTSFELKHYVLALHELRLALTDMRRPLGEEQQVEVRGLINQARGFVGRYSVTVLPAAAAVLVDGERMTRDLDDTLVLELGSHDLIVRAQGYGEIRRRLFVQGAEEQALTIELAPLPQASAAALDAHAPAQATSAQRSRGRRSGTSSAALWPWTLAGAVVTGGVALTAFLITDAAAKCAPRCTNGEASSIHTGDTITVLSAAVAGALLVTSAVALLYPSGEKEAAAGHVRFGLGPSGMDARVRF